MAANIEVLSLRGFDRRGDPSHVVREISFDAVRLILNPAVDASRSVVPAQAGTQVNAALYQWLGPPGLLDSRLRGNDSQRRFGLTQRVTAASPDVTVRPAKRTLFLEPCTRSRRPLSLRLTAIRCARGWPP